MELHTSIVAIRTSTPQVHLMAGKHVSTPDLTNMALLEALEHSLETDDVTSERQTNLMFELIERRRRSRPAQSVRSSPGSPASTAGFTATPRSHSAPELYHHVAVTLTATPHTTATPSLTLSSSAATSAADADSGSSECKNMYSLSENPKCDPLLVCPAKPALREL